MMNEINPPQPNKSDNSGMIFLWLVVAFVPSFVAIPLLNSFSPIVGLGLWILTGSCCVSAGFGVVQRMRRLGDRIFFGLFLAGVFFVLNVFIVILIGCSGMGRIAP